jgi:hypothetical protein
MFYAIQEPVDSGGPNRSSVGGNFNLSPDEKVRLAFLGKRQLLEDSPVVESASAPILQVMKVK